MEHNRQWTITRRDCLKASGLLLAGLSSSYAAEKKMTFGIATDPHYADAPSRGDRKYRESIPKMTECVKLMNDKKVDFLVELGDFKDQAKTRVEKDTLKFLETFEAVYGKFKGPRYHALGNHDMDSISKKQFLERVTNTGIAKDASYYSFDSKGLHCVVLDANFSKDEKDYDHGKFNWTDANVPKKELAWLAKDLESTSKPVVAFIHQQLDGEDNHCVKNRAQVREILQKSKKVLAVFQGHNHAGGHRLIEGIHYYTLKAMVSGSGEENNSYAIVELADNLDLTVTGYRRAVSKKMSPKSVNK